MIIAIGLFLLCAAGAAFAGSCVTPNDPEIKASSDSAAIQAAVDLAAEKGLGQVVVPRTNARTGKNVWDIEKCILLPSDMTVILDGCRLRMADGVFDNMFRNSLTYTPEGNTPEGTQRNIRLIGKNGAVLDGGLPNGLNEFTSEKNGLPSKFANLLIFLHNVEDFEVSGLECRDQRWYVFLAFFCRNGVIRDMHLRLTRHALDTHETWRNQDGIDISMGCSNILIQNIEGETGDDFIAICSMSTREEAKQWYVEGSELDVHDITVRDIRGITSMCALIRLLCHKGCKVYNISMSNIFEISRPGKEAQSQMCFRIGDDLPDYFRFSPEMRCKPGDMHDISIDNVFTRARTAINLCGCVKNLHARGIHVHSDGGPALWCGFNAVSDVFIYHPSRQAEYDAIRGPYPVPDSPRATLENIRVEDVYYTADGKHAPAVLCMSDSDMKNVIVENVNCDADIPLAWYKDGEKDRFEIKR
ncbi:MAG: hypothetical protein IK083_06445 [Abditibacteriota bacterium]|nr:hypothetical protein [Abditibacteriota bacterium]